MLLDTINNYLLIFDQEVGGFDLLEAFEMAKTEYMEGWDTTFSLDTYRFCFYDMFGEDWATCRYPTKEGIMVALVTPYCFEISSFDPEGLE